jgi:hypothetical protein
MRTNDPIPQEDPLIEMGYEPTDVGMKGIGRAGILFFGFTVFSFAIVFLGFKFFGLDASANEADKARATVIPFDGQKLPPNTPVLQGNVTAKTDIHDMRQAENESLDHYKWINRDRGLVQIPIDRAISLLSQRGLPKIGAGMAAESKGTTAPEVLRAEEAAKKEGIAP